MKRILTFLPIVSLIFALSSCFGDRQVHPIDEDAMLDSDLFVALSQERGGEGIPSYIMPKANEFNKIPQDPKNKITAEKVELGKFLYHETGIATKAMKSEGMDTYSCASCHHAGGGFQAGRIQGIGDGGMGYGDHGEGRMPNPAYDLSELDVQPIRTPSALNVAFQPLMLWNGQFGATHGNAGTQSQWTAGTPKETNFLGYQGVEIQAIAGLKVHRMEVDSGFVYSMNYKDWFDKAFNDVPVSKRYDREHAGLAIAAYERTLLATESPFQSWLTGDKDAMTTEQKKGALLFFGKAECGSCHKGPALNSMEFYALGMNDLDGPGVYGGAPDAGTKKGRGGFTQNPEDMYKFKVPQLYNLKDSPFYGHGGNFTSIRSVVEYKNQAVPQNIEVPSSQIAREFRPLNLTETEIDDLVDFLENGLYDPNLDRYVPQSLPTGYCFPNNDNMSKQDLGCY